MLATYLSAVLALLLLWNVYPKDFNYGAAAGNGLLFYNANVSHLFLMPPSLSLMNSTNAFITPYLQYLDPCITLPRLEGCLLPS